MRPAYAGPGSASSRWKPTQDPGKTSPSSNFGGNRPGGTDTNSAASKGANTQQQQQQQQDTDYYSYTSLISSSKDTIIYANMDALKSYVRIQSENNGSKCEIPLNETSICGLSIGKNQNSTKQFFTHYGCDDIEKYYI